PQHLARLRELMPQTPFLLPGIGAQGVDVAALAPALAPGRARGLITDARSIANAHQNSGSSPPDAARKEAERLREQAWSLGYTCSGCVAAPRGSSRPSRSSLSPSRSIPSPRTPASPRSPIRAAR